MAPPSKLRSYCHLLYARMDAEATDEQNVRVWRGRLIETCGDLGIPEGSYSKVVTRLRELGCIEQVTRGFRGTALSTYIVRYPPTDEVWNVKSSSDPLTTAPTVDSLVARMENLERQLGGLNVVDAMANFEKRLQQVEKANRGNNTTGSKSQ